MIQYTKGVANLDFAYNASGLRVKKHYSEASPPEGQGELGSLFTEATNDLGIKSRGSDSVYNKGRDIEKIWVKSDNNYFYFAIGQKYLYNESGKLKLFITLDIDTLQNSGRITLPEDTVKKISEFKIRNPKQYQISNDASSKYFENCEFEVCLGFRYSNFGFNQINDAYYPFGEMITGTGNVHGFTGKELDSETGLNYFCQRYYVPQIGRFITLDRWTHLPDDERVFSYAKYLSWNNYQLKCNPQMTKMPKNNSFRRKSYTTSYDSLTNEIISIFSTNPVPDFSDSVIYFRKPKDRNSPVFPLLSSN